MAEPGDSGAVLVNESNCAVGLFTAMGNNFSIFSRIATVLNQLDVEIVT